MSQADHAYRPDVDGLRAAAVAFVLVFHAFPTIVPGGFVGVDVFFVISGYLISGIILAALAERRFSFAGFFARRIRRIFPALAVVLSASLAAGWFLLYSDDYARLGFHAAAGAAFVSNFAFWKEASYFDVAADLKPLLHLWSLGVEEQFYFVWPVLLVVAARWRRGPLAMTLAVGAVSFAIAIWTVRIDPTPAFYAPWNRFWELLAGAALACVEADALLRTRLREVMSRAWLANLAAVAGVVAIGIGVALIDATRVFPGLWVALPVGGTVLLVLAGPRAWINRVILAHPAVVFVGLISYPLYLWHWPLLSIAQIVEGAPLTAMERASLLMVSVLLAAATYQLVEKPIRTGARPRATVAGLTLAMSAVCAAALIVHGWMGFMERPVNRSSAASLVDYYKHLHESGLVEAYRSECDFLDWNAGRVKDTLDPSCTAPGRTATVFLWGDSYAQALSRGVRESLPDGVTLAQVTTSACRPQIQDFDLSVAHRRCEIANRYAMDAIGRLRPSIVILAQQDGHDAAAWRPLVDRTLELGAGHVIIAGPAPAWHPSLPRVYAEHHLADRARYVSEGLDFQRFDIDRAAAAAVKGMDRVTYLSLLEQLCPSSGGEPAAPARRPACLARLDDRDPIELLAVDRAHLSPNGSAYLGQVMWRRVFAALLK